MRSCVGWSGSVGAGQFGAGGEEVLREMDSSVRPRQREVDHPVETAAQGPRLPADLNGKGPSGASSLG